MKSGRRAHSVMGLQPLLALAKERGLDPLRLLRDVGIGAASLDDRDATVSVDRVHALVAAMLERTGDPTLGLDAARHYDLTTFGLLGAVTAVIPTAREMVRLFVEYVNLTFTYFTLVLVESGDECRLHFIDDDDLGAVRRFYLDRELGFVVDCGRKFWPDTYRALAQGVEFDYAEPPEAAHYRAFFPCPVRFGADRAVAVLDLAADRPRDDINPIGLQILKEHLRSFGGAPDDSDFVGRVRRQIAASIATRGVLPDSQAIASTLALSDRALRRRLASEGFRFRVLADDVAAQYARRFLRETELSVAAVAERIGYSEPASFVRAFRRWTDMTPEGFRKQARAAAARRLG